MSPKNSGAPKKPRWTRAKKVAARRSDAAGPRAARKPFRADSGGSDQRWSRDDARQDRRQGGFSAGGERDDRRGGYGRRDEEPRGRYGAPRSGGRFDDRRSTRGRQDDIDGGWSSGRGRPERRDDRNSNRDDRRPVNRDDRRGGFNRDDRRPYQRDERRGGYDRNDGRGGFNRDDRRGGYDRGDRRPYQRDERGGGFDRGDRRPYGHDDRRGGYGRDDRGGDRRPYGRDDRRPYSRDERGGYRQERRFERRFESRGDAGGARDDRYPRRDRDERYPRRDRDERYPRRDDRREHGSAGGVTGGADRYASYGGGTPSRSRGDQADARREHPHLAPADAPVARAEQLHRKEAPVSEPVDMETNGFAKLGVPEAMVRRLARDGITAPFPIQEATIPDALAGRDVLGRGRTGSGKTLAFGLPLLARLAEGERAVSNRPKAIVLSPTRELAMQISDALQPLVHVLGLRHKLVAGGMPYPPQFDALDRGVDVLIATPGRLSDLIERGACSLDQCQIVVLDEADHMADMGFLPEVTAILDLVPVGGQRLLFSATLDKGIDTLVESYLQDPVTHSTDEAQASVTTMAHHVLQVEPVHKKVVTAHVANRGGHTIVFVRTKLGADRVAMQLREQGVFAAALHGGLSQAARNRVLSAFRDGELPVLVATDVAARGIHVDDVGVVLQVDPPADHKDYLHRAGRTARAGEQGTVVTLALPHQKKMMQRLADQAGLEVTPEKVAPGDDRLHELTGATPPMGDPIPEERLRRLLEPPPRQRGYRPGGRGQGDRRGGGPRRPRRY